MTNREKFKDVFGKDIKWSDAIRPQMLALKSAQINGIDCMEEWLNEEYYEPTTKKNLGVDCVARQDVERYIEGFVNEYTPKEELEFINLELDGLKHIPSVTPQEPKTGHWIKGYTFPDGAYWKCDKCNELIKVKIPMRYCNNCGAKMETEVVDADSN